MIKKQSLLSDSFAAFTRTHKRVICGSNTLRNNWSLWAGNKFPSYPSNFVFRRGDNGQHTLLLNVYVDDCTLAGGSIVIQCDSGKNSDRKCVWTWGIYLWETNQNSRKTSFCIKNPQTNNHDNDLWYEIVHPGYHRSILWVIRNPPRKVEVSA